MPLADSLAWEAASHAQEAQGFLAWDKAWEDMTLARSALALAWEARRDAQEKEAIAEARLAEAEEKEARAWASYRASQAQEDAAIADMTLAEAIAREARSAQAQAQAPKEGRI